MKKNRKKPTGAMWSHPSGDNQVSTFGFPESKTEIERYIVGSMLNTAATESVDLYNLIGEPTQNQENHFDFTLPTTSGEQYLDLMEIAPLDILGRSYQDAPSSYVYGDLLDIITEKISAKSKKYGDSADTRIHLLLYSTHWKFHLTERFTKLLAYTCSHNDHCFKSIIYFVSFGDNEGQIVTIHPQPMSNFADFNEAEARLVRVFLADPATAEISDDGMTVFFPVQQPSRKL